MEILIEKLFRVEIFFVFFLFRHVIYFEQILVEVKSDIENYFVELYDILSQRSWLKYHQERPNDFDIWLCRIWYLVHNPLQQKFPIKCAMSKFLFAFEECFDADTLRAPPNFIFERVINFMSLNRNFYMLAFTKIIAPKYWSEKDFFQRRSARVKYQW